MTPVSNRKRIVPISERMQRLANDPATDWINTPAQGSPWLRERLRSVPMRRVFGGVELCPHITPLAGEAIYTFWTDAVRCITCTAGASGDVSEAENFTCDRCRRRRKRITPVLLPPDPVTEAFAGIVPQTAFLFGLCDSCLVEEGGGVPQ
jgi:hypothetical protein